MLSKKSNQPTIDGNATAPIPDITCRFYLVHPLIVSICISIANYSKVVFVTG